MSYWITVPEWGTQVSLKPGLASLIFPSIIHYSTRSPQVNTHNQFKPMTRFVSNKGNLEFKLDSFQVNDRSYSLRVLLNSKGVSVILRLCSRRHYSLDYSLRVAPSLYWRTWLPFSSCPDIQSSLELQTSLLSHESKSKTYIYSYLYIKKYFLNFYNYFETIPFLILLTSLNSSFVLLFVCLFFVFYKMQGPRLRCLVSLNKYLRNIHIFSFLNYSLI